MGAIYVSNTCPRESPKYLSELKRLSEFFVPSFFNLAILFLNFWEIISTSLSLTESKFALCSFSRVAFGALTLYSVMSRFS